MKYCLNYNRDTEYANCIKKADEWTIIYNNKDTTLLEFLELNKDKRINIYIKNEGIDFDFLKELCDKYENVYIKLNADYYLNCKPNFRFFYDIQISNWDILNGVLNLGATDVYIVEDLGFDIGKVKVIASQYNAQIRVYPNIAQSKWSNSDAIKKFFIRPEDIDNYEDYVDVIEFYNVDKNIDIYYDIYKNKKKWFGKLNEIILDFNSEIDNKYIVPRFAEMRIKCNKNCIKGGGCRRCEVIEDLSNTLEQSKLIVQIDKKIKEDEDG